MDKDTNVNIATVIASAAAAATDIGKSVAPGQKITISKHDLVGSSEATEVGAGAGALIEIVVDVMGGMASLEAGVVKGTTREAGIDGESAADVATGHPKTIERETLKMAVSAEPAHDTIFKQTESQSSFLLPVICAVSLAFSACCHVLQPGLDLGLIG